MKKNFSPPTVKKLDNVLQIDLSLVVGHERILHICVENSIRYRSYGDGDWTDIHDLGFSYACLKNSMSSSHSLTDLFKEPGDESVLIEFEKKYQCNIWRVIKLIYQSREARELFLSAGTLFWLTLSRAEAQLWPDHFLLELYSQKRRQILGECGFPATNAMLKVISKFFADRFDTGIKRTLFSFDWQKQVQRLRHLPRIDQKRLSLIEKHPGIENAHFIRNPDKAVTREAATCIEDCFRMCECSGRDSCLKKLCMCETELQLTQLHDQMVLELIAEPASKKFSSSGEKITQFPEAPIAGNETIKPITTSQELYIESQIMAHCVAGYAERILSGNYYVYRVFFPERATLGIHISKERGARIDQIQGRKNRPVTTNTREVVIQWFNSASRKTKDKDQTTVHHAVNSRH
ncbi:MAG: hypothetical protein CSB48_10110 [Proteobacteria bacterium]|nr:MAG: hypothetical protein CSB48_10110 [Pseudomonadota bacterium]